MHPQKIMAWLRLIRWKNLVIIFLTQLLAWWCISIFEEPEVLYPMQFLLVSLSTISIAAAGYIINDYFDIKIDQQNRPQKVVLGNTIPPKQAIVAHFVLNIIALLFAALAALPSGHPEWLLLQAGCTLLLWFYSTHFKRQYMVGNVVVALLAALTILVLMVYEPVLYQYMHFPLVTAINGSPRTSPPVWILGCYAYFAFILTWMREIVKDMEDIKGDEAEGCVTMPIKKGIAFSKNFISILALFVVVPLAIASFTLATHHYIAMSLYVLVVVVSLIAWVVFLHGGRTDRAYHRASSYIKGIMLLGICSFIFYFLQLILTSGT